MAFCVSSTSEGRQMLSLEALEGVTNLLDLEFSYPGTMREYNSVVSEHWVWGNFSWQLQKTNLKLTGWCSYWLLTPFSQDGVPIGHCLLSPRLVLPLATVSFLTLPSVYHSFLGPHSAQVAHHQASLDQDQMAFLILPTCSVYILAGLCWP